MRVRDTGSVCAKRRRWAPDVLNPHGKLANSCPDRYWARQAAEMSCYPAAQEIMSGRADFLELRGFEPRTSAAQAPARLTGSSPLFLGGSPATPAPRTSGRSSREPRVRLWRPHIGAGSHGPIGQQYRRSVRPVMRSSPGLGCERTIRLRPIQGETTAMLVPERSRRALRHESDGGQARHSNEEGACPRERRLRRRRGEFCR